MLKELSNALSGIAYVDDSRVAKLARRGLRIKSRELLLLSVPTQASASLVSADPAGSWAGRSRMGSAMQESEAHTASDPDAQDIYPSFHEIEQM
jgi:hypothetical protein